MTDQVPNNQSLLWISIAGIAVVLGLLYIAMGPDKATSSAPAPTPMVAEPPPAPAPTPPQ